MQSIQGHENVRGESVDLSQLTAQIENRLGALKHPHPLGFHAAKNADDAVVRPRRSSESPFFLATLAVLLVNSRTVLFESVLPTCYRNGLPT